MDRLFALFGKFIFFVIIVGGLIGIGVYIGSNYIAKKSISKVSVVVSPTIEPTSAAATSSAEVSTTPAISGKGLKTQISAGGAKPFALYTILVAPGWTAGKEHDDSIPSDKVTLTKRDYSLVISQAPSGGARCVYPGDTQGDLAESFGAYVPIANGTDSSFYRRGKAQISQNNKQGYTICQKNSEGIYGDPTTFGHINYLVPSSADNATLLEMDGMVASIQKQ